MAPDDTESSFYHPDGINNIRQLTDETAAETNRYDYDAWLQIRSSTGTVTNPQTGKGLFSAYRREDDGLYGTHNRFYEADSGRWKSADPAEADLNLYRYVNNNPINNDDPSGLQSIAELETDLAEAMRAERFLRRQLAVIESRNEQVVEAVEQNRLAFQQAEIDRLKFWADLARIRREYGVPPVDEDVPDELQPHPVYGLARRIPQGEYRALLRRFRELGSRLVDLPRRATHLREQLRTGRRQQAEVSAYATSAQMNVAALQRLTAAARAAEAPPPRPARPQPAMTGRGQATVDPFTELQELFGGDIDFGSLRGTRHFSEEERQETIDALGYAELSIATAITSIPLLGDIIDGWSVLSGKDVLTEDDVKGVARLIAAILVVLPIVNSRLGKLLGRQVERLLRTILDRLLDLIENSRKTLGETADRLAAAIGPRQRLAFATGTGSVDETQSTFHFSRRHGSDPGSAQPRTAGAEGVAPRTATVGKAVSTNYRKTFFDAYPHLKGKVVVHHGVEQQVLDLYPGRFTPAEIHSLENLRGIPRSINPDVHLSKIRKEWNKFYRNNANATRQQILDEATRIDSLFGSQFDPPL